MVAILSGAPPAAWAKAANGAAVAATPGGSGYHFAPDPSSQRASTIGGNASTNAGGIHTLKDFVTSNHILGMEMVLADGSVVEIGGRGGCCPEKPSVRTGPAFVKDSPTN